MTSKLLRYLPVRGKWNLRKTAGKWNLGRCDSPPLLASTAIDDEPECDAEQPVCVDGRPCVRGRCLGSPPLFVDAGADAHLADGSDVTGCSILPQSGCPSGQRCILRDDGRRCVANGALPHGTECSADEDCAAGFCRDIPFQSCTDYCSDDEDCADNGPGSRCAFTIHVGSESIRVCSIDCDPLTGTGCREGIQCNAQSDSVVPCHTDCNAQSTPGTEGQECREHLTHECAVGTACEEGLCRPYCIIGEPCEGRGECVLRGGEACVVGSIGYGVCI